MKIKSLLLFATVLSFACLNALGSTFYYSGTTAGAYGFNRPTEAADALSEIGSAAPYFAQPFTVDQSGTYTFSVMADDPTAFDTFVHLYSGSFNPTAPLSYVTAGNDDAVNGSPQLGSALNGLPLIAGNSYIMVVSGFGNSDFGGFSASISGPGNIALVPEPSVPALAGLGFAGFWLLRWGRRGNR